ncbi:hypothetical protein [Candidatus Methylomicrobium oryzae]|jgi:hypothetical protein|uniref:hypothetical protein n=1 Tax=Candidatus Methylomicrobium oryzae TaxID=2802053 RepID=UPI001F1DFE17|nr:hypothetical protein [Methylomicrobium sp. RS1]
MSEQTEEKMSDATKLMWAVIGVFVIGFVVVAVSKQESPQQVEAQSMLRNYVAIQQMANQKCPAAILKETGEEVFFPAEDPQTDKETYITLKWKGEKKFKEASCTLHGSLGGISELVIDGKTIIKKQI